MVTGINLNFQDLQDGANAALKAVNSAGGIKGHPVAIMTCTYTVLAPTDSDQCVRGAIADQTDIALVGSNVNGADADPLLAAAQMANVGGPLGYGLDFTTPALLPVQGGSLVQNLAQALTCVRLHAKKIAIPYLDNGPSAASLDAIKKYVLAPNGLDNAITVPIPITATDLSAEAAATSQGDCVVVATFGTYATTLVQDLLHTGYTTKPIVLGGASFSAQAITQDFGAAATNIYTANMANLGSAGYQNFLKEVKAYNPSIVSRVNDFTAQTWLGLHVLVDVANSIPGKAVPTRAMVWDQLHKLKGYNTDGLTVAPLDFTVKGTALGGSIPNLFPSAAGMWANKFVNGSLEPLGSNAPLPVPS